MTALTLRGLFARKLRAGLTALAVLLGVMMISGTYVFTDTINHSFDRIFETANKGIAIKVVPHKTVDSQEIAVPPFDASLLGRVKAAKGVAVAAGGVSDTATILDENGKRANKGFAPALMFSKSPKPFTPLIYSEGLPPGGPNDATIDANTAKRLHLTVGDRIRIGAKEPVKEYRISGLGKFGDVSSFGGATIAVLTLPEAQRISKKRGKLDEIDVALAPGANAKNVQAELRRALPRSVDVRTGAEDAQQQSDDIHSGLSFLNTLLLAFAGIALFVGAFIIFNTFAITVAQRTTEFGLLRTLGASRRQILRSVLLEALLIGIGASILGLLAGHRRGEGDQRDVQGFPDRPPGTGDRPLPRTIIVSLLVGTIVTVVASLSPARRATRVPPIAALRHDVVPTGTAGRRRTVIAIVLTAIGIVLLALGLFAASGAGAVLGLMAIGAILVFIGVALLSNRIVPAIASVIGWPLERLRGVAGRLARENAVRNPGRTAVTAAALMIGLALVTFVTVLAAGLRASINDTVDKSFAGDLVLINKDGGSPIPHEAGRAGRAFLASRRFPRSTRAPGT